MIKIYKYRIYPTPYQQTLLNKHLGCARFVYNFGLGLNKEAYESAKDGEKPKRLTSVDLSRQITQLKKNPDYLWLSEVNADSLIFSLRNLDTAYKNFFRRIKNGETPGFPKFKSKYKFPQSYQFRKSRISEEEGWLYIPKVGRVKTVFHRPVIGEHFTHTRTLIKTASGKWFVSIVADDGEDPAELPPVDYDRLLGVDHGVVTSLTLSNGYVFDIDTQYLRLNKRMELLQKRLSSKKKGSNNRRKARLRLARVHEKIAWKRKFDIENMVVAMIGYLKKHNYSGIVIRKYDIKSMIEKIEPIKKGDHYDNNGRELQKKHNRMIASSGLGYVFSHIKEKLPQNGLHVFEIDAGEEATTKKCCACESRNVVINLKGRTIRCKDCGKKSDMDLNAAINTVHHFLSKQEMIEKNIFKLGELYSGPGGIGIAAKQKLKQNG